MPQVSGGVATRGNKPMSQQTLLLKTWQEGTCKTLEGETNTRKDQEEATARTAVEI